MENKGMKPATRDDLAKLARRLDGKIERTEFRLGARIDRVATRLLNLERATGLRLSRLEDLFREGFGELKSMAAEALAQHKEQIRTNLALERRIRRLEDGSRSGA